MIPIAGKNINHDGKSFDLPNQIAINVVSITQGATDGRWRWKRIITINPITTGGICLDGTDLKIVQ